MVSSNLYNPIPTNPPVIKFLNIHFPIIRDAPITSAGSDSAPINA